MPRENVNDLLAFLAVARERSFTKAAAKAGVSQSALSHTVRQLEARLGVRLLARTTRAVSLTEAGERLLNGIGPHFDEIDVQIEALGDFRQTLAANIRISASDHAINHVLWPKLKVFLAQHPEIRVEILRENGLTDIVTERFDAGVRMGEQLAKNMISARIGPDMRFAAVATPAYFQSNPPPLHPQELTKHVCINERLPTYGGFWAWEFEKDGRELRIRVEGQLAFNNTYHCLEGALNGFGIAYVPEDIALPHIEAGRLQRVLEDWCAPWDGYYLYYASKRQSSPAFLAMVDALRHRG